MINNDKLKRVSYLFVELKSSPGVFLYKINQESEPYFTDLHLNKLIETKITEEDEEIIDREVRANLWAEALNMKRKLDKLLVIMEMSYPELVETEENFKNSIKKLIDGAMKPKLTLVD